MMHAGSRVVRRYRSRAIVGTVVYVGSGSIAHVSWDTGADRDTSEYQDELLEVSA